MANDRGAEIDLSTKRLPTPIIREAEDLVHGRNRERMRQGIAYVLLGTLAFTILATFLALGVENLQGVEDILSLIYAPLIGLVGAATGFYYGTSGSSQGSR